MDVDFLETPKRNLNHHRKPGKQGDEQCPPFLTGKIFHAVVYPNQADNQGGRRRAGHADEPAFVRFAGSDQSIEQGQAQGGAGAINKGDGIADFAEVEKLPFVGNQCGGDAEADHVRQTVELFAERALAVRPACDTAVHAVKQHRNENGDGGGFVVTVHGLGDGVKSGKQGGDGKGIGQHIDAVPPQAAADFHAAAGWFCGHNEKPSVVGERGDYTRFARNGLFRRHPRTADLLLMLCRMPNVSAFAFRTSPNKSDDAGFFPARSASLQEYRPDCRRAFGADIPKSAYPLK